MIALELWPYVDLVLVGFLPNEIWRALGLLLARGLNEDSEIVVVARGCHGHSGGGHRQADSFSQRRPHQYSLVRACRSSRMRLCGFHCHTALGLRRRCGRRSRFTTGRLCVCPLDHSDWIAAASFLACSARTSGFSFSL